MRLRILVYMALLTLIVLLLLPQATQAAPAAAGRVTHVSGWAYRNSRGTGTATYVVRATVVSISYGKYYTARGWVLSPVAVYRDTSRQVTWTPPDNSWASAINGWGYYAWGRDEPLIW